MRKVAQSVGVSVPVLYKWKKDLISDEAYQSMRKRKAAPQDTNQDALLGEIQRLRQHLRAYQKRNVLWQKLGGYHAGKIYQLPGQVHTVV